MGMTDPLADLFIRILNASKRGHEKVLVPASKLKADVLRVFKSEGFIKQYGQVTVNGHPQLEIQLRYFPSPQKKSFITGIRRVSRPGQRKYVGKSDIPRVMGGLGIGVLTTSKGVLTDQDSRRDGVGGELLCYIW